MKKLFLSVCAVVGVMMAGSMVFAQAVPSTNMPMAVPPKIKQPMLNIGPDGHFKAQGMQVISVSGDSFQGQVWGITYTVNFTDAAPEFLNRGGAALATTTGQLAAGDEVGVEGKVASSSPMVVSGRVIRNYAITNRMRPPQDMMGKKDGSSENVDGRRPGMPPPGFYDGAVGSSMPGFAAGQSMSTSGAVTSSVPGGGEMAKGPFMINERGGDINQKINDLVKQVQELQGRMKKLQPMPTPAPAPIIPPSATQ